MSQAWLAAWLHEHAGILTITADPEDTGKFVVILDAGGLERLTVRGCAYDLIDAISDAIDAWEHDR